MTTATTESDAPRTPETGSAAPRTPDTESATPRTPDTESATPRTPDAAASGTTARTATGIAAVALAGALVLTACDSGGPDPQTSRSGAPSASASPHGTSPAPGGSPGAGGTTRAENAPAVDGSWLTTRDGALVVLTVEDGRAALFATDRTVCAGTAPQRDGKRLVRLTGCGRRTVGTVDSVNATTLRVTWEGGLGTETYTRSEGGALPSGLPTASLGS
ncbi:MULTISPECIES: hypothetical protein [Streptomyces]|uniref:hypothetical protein n=1 Tax=Streptomyces TaxID=1883 RepID=UPI00199EBF02|nr:hypothetical protein [Streptomyces thermoviolaceus]GGV70941.1 hypothetical protein GCM10010499_21180 [Streptomyces thermoviolaceus subsp. apingens]